MNYVQRFFVYQVTRSFECLFFLFLSDGHVTVSIIPRESEGRFRVFHMGKYDVREKGSIKKGKKLSGF